VKFGKFELDNVISEKRILTLSQNGGLYQAYHYLPFVDPRRQVRWFCQQVRRVRLAFVQQLWLGR